MGLELEEQVTSLEPSKELKKLGVKQDSFWYWVLIDGYFDYKLVQKGYDIHLRKITKDFCSAFTVAEHGKALPDWVDFTQKHYNSTSKRTWYRCYTKEGMMWVDEDKEADARAKMRIWLIKNKRMEVNQIELAGAVDILMNAPVLFGLKQQGHLPTIERMLEDGATWKEIGKEIGWCPETAKEDYERHIEYKRAHEHV